MRESSLQLVQLLHGMSRGTNKSPPKLRTIIIYILNWVSSCATQLTWTLSLLVFIFWAGPTLERVGNTTVVGDQQLQFQHDNIREEKQEEKDVCEMTASYCICSLNCLAPHMCYYNQITNTFGDGVEETRVAWSVSFLYKCMVMQRRKDGKHSSKLRIAKQNCWMNAHNYQKIWSTPGCADSFNGSSK
jgi:hypothetical protein